MILAPVYRYVTLILIAGIIAFLSFNPLSKIYFGDTADEGYYYKYASAVEHKGLPEFQKLIAWYSSSDTARKHPAPVRVGFILLCAFLFKFSAHPSIPILAFISTISFFLFILVCFYYVRRYFDLDTSLLTALLLASSPLMMGLSRRALIDSTANLLWALAVWLFLDVLSKPKRFSYIGFLITLFVSITFKESSLVLVPFFVMAGIWGKRKGADISVGQIWGIIICPLAFVVLFYDWIFGGLGVLKTAVWAISRTHFSSAYSNSYAINYCSGYWAKYLLDYLLLIPITTLLFIGYVGYVSVQRKVLDFNRSYFLLYFVYVYGVMSCLAHSKVVRFVVNLEMVISLFAVLMLAEIFKALDANKRQFLIFFITFGMFMYNWFSFLELFYKPSLLDPISLYLLICRHIIPS